MQRKGNKTGLILAGILLIIVIAAMLLVYF